LQLADTLGLFMFRTQSGLLRNSHIDDSVQYAGLFSANATLNLPANLQALLSYRSDTRFPDIDELRYIKHRTLWFPNKNLKPEERERTTADIQWNAGGIFYGLGIRHEKMEI
jgi:outer membrane receptor protein involved in Fe transport